MMVVENEPMKLVDLFVTRHPYFTSIRDALLFQNYAEPKISLSHEMDKNAKALLHIKVWVWLH